ncbi:MAG: hypothetical protein FWE82_06180, partial [Defluviitaleaceae bacterium]|nr:hypothetical protein [Defluviitaleaceae bacterium]
TDENLAKAAEIFEKLKDEAFAGAKLTFGEHYLPPEIQAMTSNERRSILIGILNSCRVLELQAAELLQKYLNKAESYFPDKPEIVSAAIQARKNTGFPATFTLPNKSAAIPPEIKHIGPSYVPFANEFNYFLDYTGQSYGYVYEGDWRKSKDYIFADVISGNALRPVAGLVPTQNEINHIYKAAGFNPVSYCANKTAANYMSEADMKETVRQTLHELRQPVVLPTDNNLFGAIVVGYKNDGDTLIVYGFKPYFMDMENNAAPVYIEVSDWYNDKTALTVIGRRGRAVPETEMHAEGLRSMRRYLNENMNGADKNYFYEWEAFLRMNKIEMISHVRRTQSIPGGEHGTLDMNMDDGAMWKAICAAHGSTWCNMAERRFYVAQFLYKIMGQYPAETQNLMHKLADHYWESSKIMGGDYGGDPKKGYGREVGDPVDPEIFERQDVRERMAICVKIFKEADAKGLEMIEEIMDLLPQQKSR